jgi:hypothetical protein
MLPLDSELSQYDDFKIRAEFCREMEQEELAAQFELLAELSFQKAKIWTKINETRERYRKIQEDLHKFSPARTCAKFQFCSDPYNSQTSLKR